jgi:putative ABC transport system substrate-binding protein
MSRRRQWLVACGLGAVVGSSFSAPAATKPRRVGALLFDRQESWADFRDGLRSELAALGWVDGSSLAMDWRFAEGDAKRLPALAAALCNSGVDAIVTRGTPATRALQQATKSIPILTGVGDPVGSGFAQSFARPGGNISGISYALNEISQKQFELLREAVPRMSRLTFVVKSDRRATADETTRMVRSLARGAAIESRFVFAADAPELRKALPRAGDSGSEAALVHSFGASISPGEVAAIVLAARLPAMFDQRAYVDAGGLMSYRLDWENQTRRTAAQLDKVLRGTSPAQIPFELPTRSELVVNATTAKALGVTLPGTLLLQADAVVT